MNDSLCFDRRTIGQILGIGLSALVIILGLASLPKGDFDPGPGCQQGSAIIAQPATSDMNICSPNTIMQGEFRFLLPK